MDIPGLFRSNSRSRAGFCAAGYVVCPCPPAASFSPLPWHRMPKPAGSESEAGPTRNFWALMLGSIGVVYGDIGTSPLYAFRESALAATGHNAAAREEAILGILSLITWALLLIVTVKYVVILLLNTWSSCSAPTITARAAPWL